MNSASELLIADGGQVPHRAFDVQTVRADFPILKRRIHGKPLIYLDNAATSQKPQVVIDTLTRYYSEENANIHRGAYFLSEQATQAYEDARLKVRHFLNAPSEREIIFTRSVSEAINLVVHSYGRKYIKAGDEIIISAMEHHSNIVPWQILCEEKGAILRVVPINDAGEFQLEAYEKLLNPRTKFVAVTQVSNALGSITPVRQIIDLAHQHEIPVLIDGAQAVPHFKVDVHELDCEFYGFSGHKLYGPTGIGILYGKAKLLEAMSPYQGGGDMIRSVTFEKTIYAPIPSKFEAGTPHIAGGIGLGAAIDYLEGIGMEEINAYEQELLVYATAAVGAAPGVRIFGTAKEKAGVISFSLEDVHPHDIATILDQEGIAIRTGHHCAQPVMDRFGVPAMARASLAFYNTKEEIDALVAGIHKVKEVFG
jgi:cysteine desulfurase / selenocysteine lyase